MISRAIHNLALASLQVHAKRLCSQGGSGWQVMSAVCLERLPVITQPMTQLEKDYSEMMNIVEREESLLSDHTLRHLDDIKVAAKKKADEWMDEEAEVLMQTALEQEDQWQDELKAFKPASRETEADLSHNTRSLNRRLDRKLVLMVKQLLGENSEWMLPMGPWKEGTSLRETAEQVLSEMCGNELNVKFMGNVPCGFYQYKYPPGLQHTGAKVFFFKAQYKGGHVTLNNHSVGDHQWLLKEELHKHSNKRYASKLKKFILEI